MDTGRLRTITGLARGMTIVVAGALAVAMAAPGVGAHDDGTTSHLWLDHIKPMREPGTINSRGNPVDWTKLKGVPAGLADGTDDGVESAGNGLKKAFNVFFVDTSTIQRRVTSECTGGGAIRKILKDGQVRCASGPTSFSKTIADTGQICNGMCTEGTLVLERGRWAITAKIQVRQLDFDEDSLWVDCELHAGGLIDHSGAVADSVFTAKQTIPMQLIVDLPSATGNFNASINCRDHDIGAVDGSNLSIMAIRVDD